ncbi:hypothetical protein MMC22_007226 [Lobaria immixta]|nr:hypothetical protein [Lobaria immixta]
MIRRAACRERPFDIQPPFETLAVFVHLIDRFSARSTDLIASLLKLPAIKKISGAFGDINRDLSQMEVMKKELIGLKSFSSPLTRLDLDVRKLSTADLGHLLRAPIALKTLFYKVCPPASISFRDIRHALEPQMNCLESLGLDYDEEYEIYYSLAIKRAVRNFIYHGLMTSFISFNALKNFKIAAFFLRTTDNRSERQILINIFPPNIEMLHLNRFQAAFETLLEALEQLLAQKSPRQITSLKKLILEEATPNPLRGGQSSLGVLRKRLP